MERLRARSENPNTISKPSLIVELIEGKESKVKTRLFEEIEGNNKEKAHKLRDVWRCTGLTGYLTRDKAPIGDGETGSRWPSDGPCSLCSTSFSSETTGGTPNLGEVFSKKVSHLSGADTESTMEPDDQPGDLDIRWEQ